MSALLAASLSPTTADQTNCAVSVKREVIQGSAKRLADFVKQQPGRARQKS